MYEFITSEIRTITPKDAHSILQYNTYQGQRGVKKSHVEDLADRMKKGMFTTGSVCLAYYNGNKDCMLMDGQHTLNYAWNCFVKGKKTKMMKYLPSYPIPTIL